MMGVYGPSPTGISAAGPAKVFALSPPTTASGGTASVRILAMLSSSESTGAGATAVKFIDSWILLAPSSPIGNGLWVARISRNRFVGTSDLLHLEALRD